MKTEKDKMLAGERYNAQDPQLRDERYKITRKAGLAILQIGMVNHCSPSRLDRCTIRLTAGMAFNILHRPNTLPHLTWCRRELTGLCLQARPDITF